jgi:hypothetical protein
MDTFHLQQRFKCNFAEGTGNLAAMLLARNGGVPTHPRRAHMKTQTDLADAILAGGESDTSFDVWTLDELDNLTDLDSVRSALAGSEEAAPAL